MNVINLDYLKSLSNGNRKFIVEVISLFMAQTPVAIKSLQYHFKNNNWNSLMEVAHKVKPSFLFVGVKELEEVAGLIEKYAEKQENLELLPDLISKLDRISNQAFAELDIELRKIVKN